MKRRIAVTIAVSGMVLAAAVAIAEEASKAAQTAAPAATAAAAPASAHRIFLPGDIVWGEGPASLPKGAKMSVLHGDPAAPGIVAFRALLPAGYRVPPHWHPADEHVTVISGEFIMGMGEKFDESKGHAIPVGGVAIMPAGERHFAWTKVETVIQVHAMGPWGITYVNPQDDPRNAKQAAK